MQHDDCVTRCHPICFGAFAVFLREALDVPEFIVELLLGQVVPHIRLFVFNSGLCRSLNREGMCSRFVTATVEHGFGFQLIVLSSTFDGATSLSPTTPHLGHSPRTTQVQALRVGNTFEKD